MVRYMSRKMVIYGSTLRIKESSLEFWPNRFSGLALKS